MSTTPGHAYFDAHVGFLMGNEVEKLVKAQYTEDAILISPFDVLPGKTPPNIVRGRAAIQDFLSKWLAYHGPSEYQALDMFAETDDSISFHAVMKSQTGLWMLGEAWHVTGGFPNGMIDRHYGFAHKLS